MNYRRKLKHSSSISIFLPAFIVLVIFFGAIVISGIAIAYKIFGCIMLIYALLSLIPYFRTKNFGFILSSLYLFSMSLLILTIPPHFVFDSYEKSLPVLSGVLLLVSITLMVILIYMSYKRQLKWRGTEIFEMAAANIEESTESYTARPRPIMKLDYTKSELREFADFLSRKLICLSFMEDTRYVFMPVKTGEEIPLLYKPSIDYEGRSWVAFDFDGNVSVNISRKDYLFYKDDLAFDQLCNSMGQLFLEFFELFRKGNEIRIMDRMDELRVSVFS